MIATEEAGLLERLDLLAPDIVGLARDIGEHPELGYEEHYAVSRIAGLLERHGEPVRTGLAGLPTALSAGDDAPTPRIAILAEYDALPGIGHACGHNLIAAAAVGAFLALRSTGAEPSARLLGCPAEESTVPEAGGKIKLLEAGEFDRTCAAVMMHPYERHAIVSLGAYAARGVDFVFHGRAAHAAMAPEDGRNALDAAVATYTAVSQLRQQLPASVRVHGIITDGGQSPNVIPERAAMRYRIRCESSGALEDVSRRVVACAEGAALATGTALEVVEFMPPYAEMRQDPALARVGSEAMADLGLTTRGSEHLRFGSSDLGNVSHRLPALELGIGIPGSSAGPHTPEFAAAALSDAGLSSAVDGAKAIALTVLRYRRGPASHD